MGTTAPVVKVVTGTVITVNTAVTFPVMPMSSTPTPPSPRHADEQAGGMFSVLVL